jgi:hypothetical protein
MLKLTDFPLARPQSDTVNAHVLSASTAETDTFPAGAKYVLIKTTGPAFWRIGATASIPADTTDGTSSEYVDVASPALVAIYNVVTQGAVTAGSTALVVSSLDGFTKGTTIVVKGADTAGADLTTTISSMTATTNTITLAAPAVVSVVSTLVTYTPTTISLIAAATPTVTLSYYR